MKKCVIDIETTALHPTEGRIICMGIMDVDTGETVVFQREDEAWMIIDFLNYFRKKQFEEIIGYNVVFDIRFIFGRCLKHGLMAPWFFSSRYNDLMHTMKSVKPIWSMNRPGTLGQWTEFLFGDDGKMKLDEDVLTMYNNGDIEKIVEYNRVDVEVTYKLWKSVNKVIYYGR